MNPLRFVNYVWPAFISMVILSAIVASLPDVLANEPSVTKVENVETLESPTGNWQDLQGDQTQDNQQWSWDIEESDGIISENLEYEMSPELSDDSPVVDLEKEDEE